MTPIRFILLIAIVVFSNSNVSSQNNQINRPSASNSSTTRKMEVIGYASVTLAPNVVYVSFSTKEYVENGKTVSLAEQEKSLKQAVKDIGYEEKNLKVMNLLGYSTFTMNGEEGSYQKTRTYLLKLRGINCIDKFLSKIDMKLLNNFSIESYDHNDINGEVRKLQISAFERGRDKADALLAIYGEKRGNILDIQEVHRYITYPKIHGNSGNVHHIVSMVNGTEYKEMPTNDLQDIKIEYQVKLIFEILDNDKKDK